MIKCRLHSTRSQRDRWTNVWCYCLALLVGPEWAYPTSASEHTVTYSQDVAKIVHEKCASCHRPGSSGPFSLLHYGDVKSRAATIEGVLDAKYMPPWKPVDHGIAFANSRELTDSEEQTIRDWIRAGCPEGDPELTPKPPEFPDGWTLGEPDLVVRMNGEFRVPADGPDIYRSFVFPIAMPEDKWVKAVELRPQAKSSLHHAIFFLDPNGSAREMDGSDGQAGVSGMNFLANTRGVTAGGGSLLDRLRSVGGNSLDGGQVNRALNRGLGGFVPGTTPSKLPGDWAMFLPRGSDVVMQTHFHPSGKEEVERATLALYFADQPPTQPIVPVMIPPMFGFGKGIKIPAGENNYRVTDKFTLPVDSTAIGVSGHAHYVCREMKLTASLPNKTSQVLLHIDDWDLDWQDQYWFERPLELPAGTELRCELVYDNSVDNPENPSSPPQPIRWGRGSNDEMGSVTLMTVATESENTAELQKAVVQHFRTSLVERSSADLAQMLMQLDNDYDGKLQTTEAPPTMSGQIFRILDRNQDGGVDEAEVLRILKLRDGLSWPTFNSTSR